MGPADLITANIELEGDAAASALGENTVAQENIEAQKKEKQETNYYNYKLSINWGTKKSADSADTHTDVEKKTKKNACFSSCFARGKKK